MAHLLGQDRTTAAQRLRQRQPFQPGQRPWEADAPAGRTPLVAASSARNCQSNGTHALHPAIRPAQRLPVSNVSLPDPKLRLDVVLPDVPQPPLVEAG